MAAVEAAGVILSVGHILRYTPYTRALKHVLDSGRIGDVVSVQHLEPVGFWHQAHSFVRGNWRREDQASSMLMAKSCHDLDWLQYVLGRAAGTRLQLRAAFALPAREQAHAAPPTAAWTARWRTPVPTPPSATTATGSPRAGTAGRSVC